MTTLEHQSLRSTKKVASLISSWIRATTDSAFLHLIIPSCLARPVPFQRPSKANAMPRLMHGLRTFLTQLAKWTTPSLRWNQQFPIWVSVASFSANFSLWKWCWRTSVNRTSKCRSVSVSWAASFTKTTPLCSNSSRIYRKINEKSNSIDLLEQETNKRETDNPNWTWIKLHKNSFK